MNKSFKNRIILLLATLVATSNCVLAKPLWDNGQSANPVSTDKYGQKVISDINIAATKKEQQKQDLIKQKNRDMKNSTPDERRQIQEDLDNINSNTEMFFTSVKKQTVDKRLQTEASFNQLPVSNDTFNDSHTLPPIKRLRLKIKNWRNHTNNQPQNATVEV